MANASNHRVIRVKFLGPTNKNDHRIFLSEDRSDKIDRKIISWDWCKGSTVDQAMEYLESIGIETAGFGTFGNQFFIFSKSWTLNTEFISITNKPKNK